MRYCEAESLSGLGCGVSPYLTVTVSVLLRMERTLRYHNKLQGLQSTECVHQLNPESVESVWLVAAVTYVRRVPQVDCFPIATAGKLTVHRDNRLLGTHK